MSTGLPRVLSILITAFFYLFVLEGFSPEFSIIDSFWHFVLATGVLLITILAWKKPKIGGIIFAVSGAFFLVMGFFRKTSWSVLFLPGVLILNGGLFLTEGFYKKEKKD